MNKLEKKSLGENLEAIRTIVDQMERLLGDLQELGRDAPVIEKNAKAMMSFVAILRYGISDIITIRNLE